MMRRCGSRPVSAYIKQHHDSIAALQRAVARLDIHALAGLGIAVPALGSLVLGLALAEGELDAEAATALGALDELFQAELWGEDARRWPGGRRSGLTSRWPPGRVNEGA